MTETIRIDAEIKIDFEKYFTDSTELSIEEMKSYVSNVLTCGFTKVMENYMQMLIEHKDNMHHNKIEKEIAKQIMEKTNIEVVRNY